MSKISHNNEAAKLKAERYKLKKYLRKGEMLAIARTIGVTGSAVQNWFYGATVDSPIIEEHVNQLVAIRKQQIEERSKELFKI